MAFAAAALESGLCDRLILSRPAVEAGERLGFLPGDMREKVDPYLRPLYDALYDTLGSERVERGLETGMIEIAPLAFMRGRTLSNAMVILDEAQNCTAVQLKMFLTRLGDGSKMIVTGDPTQVDLPKGQDSGLFQAIEILRGIEEMGREIFGPVLSIMKFDSEEEALEVANDTPYGLTNYVQTADGARRNRLARRLRSGMVEMNGQDRAQGSPFGGMKQSGNGREGGYYGLIDFLEVKAVSGWDSDEA